MLGAGFHFLDLNLYLSAYRIWRNPFRPIRVAFPGGVVNADRAAMEAKDSSDKPVKLIRRKWMAAICGARARSQSAWTSGPSTWTS